MWSRYSFTPTIVAALPPPPPAAAAAAAAPAPERATGRASCAAIIYFTGERERERGSSKRVGLLAVFAAASPEIDRACLSPAGTLSLVKVSKSLLRLPSDSRFEFHSSTEFQY